MKVFLTLGSLFALCLLAVACHRHHHPDDFRGKPPIYTCSGLGKTYPAVKRHSNGNTCNTAWDVAMEPASSKPDDHPEVGFYTAKRQEKLHFHHSKMKTFTYSVQPNPPAQGCPINPLEDSSAGNSQNTHDPTFVAWPDNAPAECHYKFTFVVKNPDGTTTTIDPHIAVGK